MASIDAAKPASVATENRLQVERSSAITVPTNTSRQPTSQDRREYLLQEMRCARLRARLWQSDIEAVGLALKAGLIDPKQAIDLLSDCDALHLLGALEGAPT